MATEVSTKTRVSKTNETGRDLPPNVSALTASRLTKEATAATSSSTICKASEVTDGLAEVAAQDPISKHTTTAGSMEETKVAIKEDDE